MQQNLFLDLLFKPMNTIFIKKNTIYSLLFASLITPLFAQSTDTWTNKLAPISESDWDYAKARHLIDRVGFGEKPKNIERFVRMGPRASVPELVYFQSISKQ